MLGLAGDSVLRKRERKKWEWRSQLGKCQLTYFPSHFKDYPEAKTAKASGIASMSSLCFFQG